MKFVKGFIRYWYDFIIGDDWKIAAAVVLALAIIFINLKLNLISGSWLVISGAGLIMISFAISLYLDVRAKTRF